MVDVVIQVEKRGYNGENIGENIKIIFDDIRFEVEYWNLVVLCGVLGENLFLQVMDGFFYRIWGKMGIDKIVVVVKGIFIVRFNSIENVNKVVDDGCFMFDKKLVIIQKWYVDLYVRQINIMIVFVWVCFNDLELKYWE